MQQCSTGMMLRRGRMAGLACLASVLVASAASAATIYVDRLAFESTLLASVTDDYSGYGEVTLFNAQMSAVVGETIYTSTGFTNYNIVSGVGGDTHYCSGCNGSFELDFTSTSVGTSDGVFGVGFNIFGGENTYGTTAFVTYGDGSTENIAIGAVGLSDGEVFLGFTDDRLISTIHFGLVDGGGTTSGALMRFAIDDLTIGSKAPPAVPLPASAILLGASMLTFGVARRRRRAPRA